MDVLARDKWDPATTVEGLVNQIRATLLANGARVDLEARKVRQASKKNRYD